MSEAASVMKLTPRRGVKAKHRKGHSALHPMNRRRSNVRRRWMADSASLWQSEEGGCGVGPSRDGRRNGVKEDEARDCRLDR
eukprot:scaffold55552_cov75-Cyclotella_meneghiniana.AAC.6